MRTTLFIFASLIPLPPCLAATQNAELTDSDLNALVFDFLVVEGYSDAAVEFAREAGISSTIDQDMIQERMEIRQAVEDGRVDEAVRRVNELDPEVR